MLNITPQTLKQNEKSDIKLFYKHKLYIKQTELGPLSFSIRIQIENVT